MRKNAVNRELREINGGVCAPVGFKANGVHCGISRELGKKDLALVVADRRCPTACVFSVHSAQSASALVSKKHLKNGIARAILINSGVANVFLENGEWLAEKICRVLAARSDIDVNETLLASTGKVGSSLSLAPFEDGIPTLVKGLSDSEEGSYSAANAIATEGKESKQVAFEFDLGDFSCKIGAIYKGDTRVCPNMATTLVILTTDVNILPEMLQKALTYAVKDTFNLICIDGIESPNDTVCIMANGKAGNYKIFCEDTEYAKFAHALREVLAEICRRIIQDGDAEERMLICKIGGAKSKQVARALAKRIVCGQNIKTMILSANFRPENILYEINSIAEDVDFSKIQVSVATQSNDYVLYEDGRPLFLKKELLERLLTEKRITLSLQLRGGNFGATASGCLAPREHS